MLFCKYEQKEKWASNILCRLTAAGVSRMLTEVENALVISTGLAYSFLLSSSQR